MDVLIVEALAADVAGWLAERHALRLAPELARDPQALRTALAPARALVLPPAVALDASLLQYAPRLRVVARLAPGPENIDLDACARGGIEVVRPAGASAAAEAEFIVGALLQMLRRVPVCNAEGLRLGRELGAAVVGVVGITPTIKPLAQLLTAFGARVTGYDPGVHASDPVWQRAGVEPVSLLEMVRGSDCLCLLLAYYSRYRGLFGERLLSEARPNQVVLCLSHSRLFDEAALAHALTQGPLAAAWMDSLEPGALDEGRPLHPVGTLQVTPRVAGSTHESRVRATWAVARRMVDVLALDDARGNFRTTLSAALADPAADPGPA